MIVEWYNKQCNRITQKPVLPKAIIRLDERVQEYLLSKGVAVPLIDDGGSDVVDADDVDVAVDNSSMNNNNEDGDIQEGRPLHSNSTDDVNPKTSAHMGAHGLTSAHIHGHASSADTEKTSTDMKKDIAKTSADITNVIQLRVAKMKPAKPPVVAESPKLPVTIKERLQLWYHSPIQVINH